MRRALVLAAVVSTLGPARSARATPTSKLVYSRSSDADSCPDGAALRQAVAARVGYDPFFPYAARTIVAKITRHGQRFVATVDLVDESGISHGARELHGEGGCGELFDAVALAIAIAIDPQSLARPSPPPAPPPQNAPAGQPPAPPPPDAAAPPPEAPVPSPAPTERVSSVAFELSAGVSGSAGTAPTPAAGLALGGGARWRAFSLGIEGRVDAPASGSAQGGGTVSTWRALGALVPCLHLGPVFGCALAQAGSVRASASGVPGTHPASLPWIGAGGRVGVRLQLRESVGLELRADLVADLDPPTFNLDGQPAWKAPPVAASLGAGVVVHFR